MLYEIGWKVFDFAMYIGFALLIVVDVVLLKKLSEPKNKDIEMVRYGGRNNIYARIMLLFLGVVFGIGLIFNVCEKAYLINEYKNQRYEIVEGSVENFEIEYDNGGLGIRWVRFSVNGKDFKIHGDADNAYDYSDGTITGDGQWVKVYYQESNVEGVAEEIFRIDGIE